MDSITRPFGSAATIESPVSPPTNAEIAAILERVSAFFLAQRASIQRTRAWSRAASIVRALDRQVRDIVRAQGVAGIDGISGITRRIARAIDEIVRTRGLALLARLEGDLGPDSMLPAPPAALPSVAALLEVDRRYRELAARGELPRVAPRRFNASNATWLPVLHEELDGFHLHAMFSNTARAHELDRVTDWVAIFAERDGVESQFTVMTEPHGPHEGRRVVRGREDELPTQHSSSSA